MVVALGAKALPVLEWVARIDAAIGKGNHVVHLDRGTRSASGSAQFANAKRAFPEMRLANGLERAASDTVVGRLRRCR